MDEFHMFLDQDQDPDLDQDLDLDPDLDQDLDLDPDQDQDQDPDHLLCLDNILLFLYFFIKGHEDAVCPLLPQIVQTLKRVLHLWYRGFEGLFWYFP